MNDLDIYLSDENGNRLLVSTGKITGDPFEVLPFTVQGNTPATNNLMVIRNGEPLPMCGSNILCSAVT